jgi:hypothetical protein
MSSRATRSQLSAQQEAQAAMEAQQRAAADAEAAKRAKRSAKKKDSRAEGTTDAIDTTGQLHVQVIGAPVIPALADSATVGSQQPGGVDVQQQLLAMQQIMQDQRKAMLEQQQEIALLKQTPSPSPTASAQASPRLSPQQHARAHATSAAAAAAAPTSRFAKKEPRAQDLREYDGAAGARLDSWLDELALASMLYELNAREAVLFAVSRLRGAALQWWLALGSASQAAVTDSAALAAALRARFQPVTAARTAREQLDKLAQGSRGVNEYIADFQRLHTQLPNMAAEDALYAFERGLRRELAVELRKQGVTSLQDAIALVARIGGLLQASAPQNRVNQMDIDDGDGSASRLDRIEAALNALTSGGGNNAGLGAKTQTQRGYQQERSAGGRGGGRGGRGGRFGGRGGAGASFTIPGVPAAVVEQRRAAGQCFRCGSADHRSMECPSAPSATQPSF